MRAYQIDDLLSSDLRQWKEFRNYNGDLLSSSQSCVRETHFMGPLKGRHPPDGAFMKWQKRFRNMENRLHLTIRILYETDS